MRAVQREVVLGDDDGDVGGDRLEVFPGEDGLVGEGDRTAEGREEVVESLSGTVTGHARYEAVNQLPLADEALVLVLGGGRLPHEP